MKSIIKLIIIALFVNFLTSCGHNQLDIDTSNVKQEPVVFKRLDKDVFSLTPENVASKMVEYQNKYSTFYTRYVSSIVNNGGKVDSLYSQTLLRFVNNQDIKNAYKDLTKTYTDNDVELIGDDMTEAVKRFKVFFPKRKTPKQFVTFMSGFQYNVVYVDSTLGVGLDMYLGSNNMFYSMMELPKFRTRTMNKEHVLSDAVRGWIITEFDNADPVNNLLNHMIFYGKIFYVCDALLPNVQDSIKMGYTTAQMEYLGKYEKNVWGFFAKDNKLYDNDMKLVSEFTSDGPFTRAISKECPPRVAMWLGQQIVKSYMEHNSDVTLEDLMNEKDAQKILSKSKYKP
jgi:outer membrane lipopolysaccharide assembly protein LptE/RlpB